MSRLVPILALSACGDRADPPRPDGDPPIVLVAPTAPATLDPGGVTTCATPEARAELGPWRKHGEIQINTEPWIWGAIEERNHMAGGVMVGDLDGDATLDFVATRLDGLEHYRMASDGALVVGTRTFEPFAATFGSGGSLADYDGDGDLDMYVTRVYVQPTIAEADGSNLLLRNDGDGVFTDVTEIAGVSACGVHHRTGVESCFRSMVSSWGDFDVDGDLDLYVGNYGWLDPEPGVNANRFEPAEPDFLYRNEGDGTFTDVSDIIPDEVHDGYTFAGGFHDLDGDHLLDLYVVNDVGTIYPNRVLWNRGGGELEYDPDEASGLVISMSGMGLAEGDLNDDGWLDFVVPQWKHNQILESHADLGIWIDTTSKRGLDPDLAAGQQVGWGSDFGDLDNDGDLDLIVQYGHLFSEKPIWENAFEQPDAVYLNEPDPVAGWTYVDHAVEYGMADVGSERGGILVDLDRDGYLDLLKRSLYGPDSLYLSRCGDDGWLEVHLRQPGTLNRFGVGARIEIEAGDARWMRHVVAGGTTFVSSGPPEAHFGLGDLDRVDRIRVWWPDGVMSEVDDVDTRQQVTITRDP